jgi:hypothetical protein
MNKNHKTIEELFHAVRVDTKAPSLNTFYQMMHSVTKQNEGRNRREEDI